MSARCLVAALCFGVLSGAVSGQPLVRTEPELQEEKGVVFVGGGVGGWDILGPASQWELPRVGIRHEIRDFVWTHGFGQPFKDLQDTAHLRRKADELAEEIRKIKKKEPRRPIYLIG